MRQYPCGWEEKPLKYVVKFVSDSLPESTNPNYHFRYVDIGSVTNERGIESYSEMNFADCPSRARKRIKYGDTIVSTVRTYLKAIALIEDAENVIVSTGFSVLRSDAYDSKYLYYLCSSELVCQQVNRLAWGIAYPAISESLLGTVRVPVPPKQEQIEIAGFLTNQCATIDTTAATLEKEISTLERYRTSVIHEAVTRGLDPTAPTKPSGVDWIGNIPTHWRAERVAYHCDLESGHTPSKLHPEWWKEEECVIPWVTTGDVHRFRNGEITTIYDTEEHVSIAGLANSSARILPAGTVALSRTASVGFSIVMGCDMASSQDFADWVPGPDVDSKYLLYVFRSMAQVFERLKIGSTHKTIYMHVLKTLKMPLPPKNEQISIADYLDTRTAAIDAVIVTKRQQLDVLKRRRQSLIYEYVTGKRRVAQEG